MRWRVVVQDKKVQAAVIVISSSHDVLDVSAVVYIRYAQVQ